MNLTQLARKLRQAADILDELTAVPVAFGNPNNENAKVAAEIRKTFRKKSARKDTARDTGAVPKTIAEHALAVLAANAGREMKVRDIAEQMLASGWTQARGTRKSAGQAVGQALSHSGKRMGIKRGQRIGYYKVTA